MRTYIDIHILQTVPPSNLNRDDAGTPKQAVYGGVKRARVSSQAWKRATRVAFGEHLDESQLGTRTKKISGLLTERIAARGLDDPEACRRIAKALLADLGKVNDNKKESKKDTETAYLLFFGRPQLERLVDLIEPDLAQLAKLDETALATSLGHVSVKKILGAGHPIDVALFGRMVADLPDLNVDAATQVAHALSTHPAEVEFDYFTAVDDENPKGETGAGMIGTVEFQSATFYRYATVGLHQLADNLGGDVDATVEALRVFLTAFTTSMPTGHGNSFAHRTLPNLVTIAVRGDQPVNLVAAFENPVRTSLRDDDPGILATSINRFAAELSAAATVWGHRPALVASTYRPSAATPDLVAALGKAIPFETVVKTVTAAARERLTDGGR